MSLSRSAVLMANFTVALAGAPVAAADPPSTPQPGDPYVEAQGHYTGADDPGWIYFKEAESDGQPVGRWGCGIGPDGTVGCDAVPYPTQIGDAPPVDVPPHANQTVATPEQPGQYRHSDTLTFTRNVDVLRPGYELVNGGASCAVGWQGSVSCQTGDHGFTLYSIWGETH